MNKQSAQVQETTWNHKRQVNKEKKVSMQKINYTSRHEISKEITRACNKL